MNVHATLLNQLEAFEERFGVKVVPRNSWDKPLVCIEGCWRFQFSGWIEDMHAHAHIREGALNAVLWYFQSVHFKSTDDGTTHFNTFDKGDMGTLREWRGPTTEDALSEALTTILQQGEPDGR